MSLLWVRGRVAWNSPSSTITAGPWRRYRRVWHAASCQRVAGQSVLKLGNGRRLGLRSHRIRVLRTMLESHAAFETQTLPVVILRRAIIPWESSASKTWAWDACRTGQRRAVAVVVNLRMKVCIVMLLVVGK